MALDSFEFVIADLPLTGPSAAALTFLGVYPTKPAPLPNRELTLSEDLSHSRS